MAGEETDAELLALLEEIGYKRSFRPSDRHTRKPTWSEPTPESRWRLYSNEEITARDKRSLDLFWLRDESLEDSKTLPDPHVLAQEISDDLQCARGRSRTSSAIWKVGPEWSACLGP